MLSTQLFIFLFITLSTHVFRVYELRLWSLIFSLVRGLWVTTWKTLCEPRRWGQWKQS